MTYTIIYSFNNYNDCDQRCWKSISENIDEINNVEIIIIDPLGKAKVVTNKIENQNDVRVLSNGFGWKLKNDSIQLANGDTLIFIDSASVFQKCSIRDIIARQKENPHDLNITIPKRYLYNEKCDLFRSLLEKVYDFFEKRGERISFPWLYAIFGIFSFKKRYIKNRHEFPSDYFHEKFGNVEFAYRILSRGYNGIVISDGNVGQNASILENNELFEKDWNLMMQKVTSIDFQLITMVKKEFIKYCNGTIKKVDEKDIMKFILLETAIRCWKNKYITRKDFSYL